MSASELGSAYITFRILAVFVFGSVGVAGYGCTQLVKAARSGTATTPCTIEEIQNGEVKENTYVELQDHVALHPYTLVSHIEGKNDVMMVIRPLISLKEGQSLLGRVQPDSEEGPSGIEAMENGSLIFFEDSQLKYTVKTATVFVKSKEFDKMEEIPLASRKETGLKGILRRPERGDEGMRKIKEELSLPSLESVMVIDATEEPSYLRGLIWLTLGLSLTAILGFVCFKIGNSQE